MRNLTSLIVMLLVIMPTTAFAWGNCVLQNNDPLLERSISEKWDCNFEWVEFFDSALNTGQSDWDGGFGWHDRCNDVRPLKRYYNATYLLYNSYWPRVTTINDFSGRFVRYAGNFAIHNIDDAEGKCWKSSSDESSWADASANWRRRARFYHPSYASHYSGSTLVVTTPMDRASTMVHEARHNSNWSKDHDSNGRDPQWWYLGAWTYEVAWLRSYATHANWNTNLAARRYAANMANQWILSGFAQTPTWRVAIP